MKTTVAGTFASLGVNSAKAGAPLKQSYLSRGSGFTLIELLIAIFISAIVASAIYSVYITFYKQTAAQDLIVEAQQNARVGINLMERELINAGYNAGTTNVITVATSTSVQFLYSEPNDPGASRIKVTYNYDSVNKTLLRTEDDTTLGTLGAANIVIPDVTGVEFAYYDANGLTTAVLNDIRYVNIKLTTETKDIPPGAAAKKQFALETHLRLRSLGTGAAASSTSDTTAPAAPTGLQVREVANPSGLGGGSCGKLKVKFTGSPDGDVIGHKIYYGTTSGSYDGVINVSTTALTGADYSCTNTANVYECTLAPSNPALSPTVSYDSSTSVHAPSTAVIYYFAVKAYDYNMNYSPYSTEAYGDTSTATIAASNTTFDAGLNDSTVNPGKPGAVTGLTGADGTADGTTNLSWTAYPTASNPGVTQLAIYRSTSAFTYPISSSLEIAAITSPGSTTTYAVSGLTGCQQYYYAIAAVNCDPTLITVDSGDTASEQYAAANYGVAYGDGTGLGVDSPAGADTYPPDITPPTAPTLLTRNGEIIVGYKRVYMGVTNPTETDFTHTLVYYNTTGPSPSVDTTLGSPTYGQISGGLAVPDTNVSVPGKLTGAGRYITYVHDNEQNAGNTFYESISAMHAPALTSTQYFYTAVSYDRCGNPAVATGNTPALASLCGDGLPGDPEYGPPSSIPPINPLVKGCYSNDYSYNVTFNSKTVNANKVPMTITWDDNPLLSAIPDAAMYRVYRSPSAPFDTTVFPNTLDTTLCSASPASTCFLGFVPVGTTNSIIDNNSLTDSGTTKYSYGIVTTDCTYEEQWIPNAAAAYKFNTSGWLTDDGVDGIGVTPGMIDRDEKLNVTDDTHREVLTGVDMDNSIGTGTGASTPSTAYKHNTVTLFLENTANGPQTLDGATASYFYWGNSSARLTNVAVGGGMSTIAVTSIAVPMSSNFVNSGTFTRRASTTLGNIQLPANTRNIPMVLTFTDKNGNPIDMRNDLISIRLIIINNSTNTTSTNPICYAYATVSKIATGTTIPLGPSVNGVTQNNPSTPTFVYAVPGSSGSNNTVPTSGGTAYGPVVALGGTSTVITANITSNTLYEPTRGSVSMSSAALYYIDTALTVGTAPTSGYTAVTMTNTTGNTWTGAIPSLTDRRFWFYVIAVDSDGNYDRAPEINEGAYTYDQRPVGICDLTPVAPASFGQLAAATATTVSVKWPKVTAYTSGAVIDKTADPIFYRVFRRSTLTGSFTKLFDVPDIAVNSWTSVAAGSLVTPATASVYSCNGTAVFNATTGLAADECGWKDTVASTSGTNDFTYYVQAKNSCGADTNLGARTNYWRECVGSTTAAISVSPTSISTNGSYTVTVNDCGKFSGAADTVTAKSVSNLGSTNFYTNMSEDSNNTGLFTASILAQNIGAANTTGVYAVPTNIANATVTVSCPSTAGTGPTTYPCSGGASTTVTVKARVCDFSPSTITTLTATKKTSKCDGSNNSSKGIQLAWSTPSDTDPPTYNIWARTGDTGTWADISGSLAAGTTKYCDARPASNPGVYYYYKIVAADTCPLSSTSAITPGAPGIKY